MANCQLSKRGDDGWEMGKETISYKQGSLRNSQHKLPVCIKRLHGIFLLLKTGHFSCRWGARLPLYSSLWKQIFYGSQVEAPFGVSSIQVPIPKANLPVTRAFWKLSESSGTGQGSGLAGIDISRQGIQNIFLFIFCNTSASKMVLVQNALLWGRPVELKTIKAVRTAQDHAKPKSPCLHSQCDH